jgi:hypothetical protein
VICNLKILDQPQISIVVDLEVPMINHQQWGWGVYNTFFVSIVERTAAALQSLKKKMHKHRRFGTSEK